jgi:hypothetical protein
MAAMRFLLTILTLFTWPALSGQAPTVEVRPQAFRIHGVVRTSSGSVVAKASVTFDGENRTTHITTNDTGAYETELLAGFYTMTAHSLGDPYLQQYRGPRIQGLASSDVTLDVTLDPAEPDCDPVPPRAGEPLTAERYKAACGGGDFYDDAQRTLHAEGDVITVNEYGNTETAELMNFRLENGGAIPLP